MKLHYHLLALLLFAFMLSPKLASGQVIDTIVGCDDIPQNHTVSNGCTICDFDILYGTTLPFTPSPDAGWCGSVENDQYIGFIVGRTGTVVFEIQSFNCINGQGVQVGIYDQFNTLVGDCFNQVSPGQPQIFIAGGLTPETIYYIRVDGFSGDGCEFFIQVISGLSTDSQGGYQITVVGNQSIVRDVPSLCEDNNAAPDTTVVFDGCSYTAGYRLEPDTLPYEVRTIGTVDSFQVITWPDSMDQRALLLVELELFSNNSSNTCLDSIELPYYSHFLDLVDNASIASKAWDCNSERLVGTISESDILTNLHLLESGTQTYVVSGAGYHGFRGDFDNLLFRYRVIQGSNVVSMGSFTENDFQDTLTINHDNGPAYIQFNNDRFWQMEVAIERLGQAQPWSFSNLNDQGTECVSSIVEGRDLISPNFTGITNASLTFKFEVVASSLVNSTGTSFPSSPVVRTQPNIPNLFVDSIALPGELPPDDYVFTGIIRSLDDLSPLCGTNSTFEFVYDFTMAEPDTLFQPSITLSAMSDSVILFASFSAGVQIVTNVPGIYYAYLNCDVLTQTLRPFPVSIDLGRDSLCAGDCLFAPTGENIQCTAGSYSFLASNDTTYFGVVHIDNSDPLSLDRIDYICDSTNGEWYLDIDWSGSQGPYFLDGQIFIDSTGQAGPFPSGLTVDILLSGSGACNHTLLINGSRSCILNTTTIQSLGFKITQLSTSFLEISAPTYGWKVQLVDVLGREIISTPLQQNSNQFFVGDLLRGTYFIVVQNGNQLASEKWVKR